MNPRPPGPPRLRRPTQLLPYSSLPAAATATQPILQLLKLPDHPHHMLRRANPAGLGVQGSSCHMPHAPLRAARR